MNFFNNKPYNVWNRIKWVGNKEIGNAVPVISSPTDLNTDSVVTLEQLSNLTPSKVDESTSGTTYLGYFKTDSDSDESTAIYKIVEDSGVTSFYIPEGGLSFTYAWDDRATISYVLKTV